MFWHLEDEWSLWDVTGADHTGKCEEQGYLAKRRGLICRRTISIHPKIDAKYKHAGSGQRCSQKCSHVAAQRLIEE